MSKTITKSSALGPTLSWVSSASSWPSSPGVYWFKDSLGKVLYVGKAKNLKQRINSYKLLGQLEPKTAKLVQVAKSIKFETCTHEIEALLMEANLIKLYQPPYNRALKDDKSPFYLYIQTKPIETLNYARQTHLPQGITKQNLYGPFRSGYELKKLLNYLRRLLPYCSATARQLKLHQPCFYFHLSLCPGVCQGHISRSEYRTHFRLIRQFLNGKRKTLIKSLTAQVIRHSQARRFEQAQHLKSTIELLNLNPKPAFDYQLPHLLDSACEQKLTLFRRLLKQFFPISSSYPLDRVEGYDISNIQGKWATGSMVVAHLGQMDSSLYRHFRIRSKQTPDDPAMMKEVLTRRLSHPEWGIPHVILIDGGKTQLSAALSVIPWNIPIISLVKNPERLLIKKAKHYYTVPLNKDLVSNFLREVRDESHRFARRYHRRLTLNIG